MNGRLRLFVQYQQSFHHLSSCQLNSNLQQKSTYIDTVSYTSTSPAGQHTYHTPDHATTKNYQDINSMENNQRLIKQLKKSGLNLTPARFQAIPAVRQSDAIRENIKQLTIVLARDHDENPPKTHPRNTPRKSFYFYLSLYYYPNFQYYRYSPTSTTSSQQRAEPSAMSYKQIRYLIISCGGLGPPGYHSMSAFSKTACTVCTVCTVHSYISWMTCSAK